MDKFNREIQSEFLLKLYDLYPEGATNELMNEFLEKFGGNNNLISNLLYLESHELIRAKLIETFEGYGYSAGLISITHKGIDFVRDDGGLSAILNVTTIKIYDETIDKLSELIKSSSLSESKKGTYLSKLKELPYDATKHLTLKTLDFVLSRPGDALQLIQKLFD